MAGMRRTILTLLTASSLALAFVGVGTIGAAANATRYTFLTGSGPLCTLAPDACPDVARASNGDTVAISGQGTFVTGSEDVTGGGTFVHKDSAGNVKATGTWTAEELLSFTSFGTSPGLPANLEGGLARIEVELHPSGSTRTLEAVLRVDCAIGNSPTGAEGVQLAVEDALTFSQEVSGFTVFVNNGPALGDN